MDKPYIKYISNNQHYNEVLARIAAVKHTLWIGTADIKDVYVKAGTKAIPLLAVLDKLIKHGVSIRLLHAKEPGPNYRNDYDKFPSLWSGMEMTLCPRIHFKLIVFDLNVAYIGSANLTGAGIGMKSSNRRNFEAGILTNEPSLVNAVIEQFDEVWRGSFCEKCGRKKFCKEQMR